MSLRKLRRTRNYCRWGLALFVLCGANSGLSAFVSNPKISGPIPVSGKPGDRSRNYPYLSMQAEVAKQGYREDEFYVEGTANAYVVQPLERTATPDAGNPYAFKTRVIVRRPVSASRFNGTAILEWINISSNADQENDWWWSHEHMMRAGYAYIGVSAQPRGIEGQYGLKKWNAARYGSLNVNAGGKFTTELSYDIYSQVAQAVKRPEGVKLLGDFKVRNIIATGHSASAARLSDYYNAIHPLAGVIDGFVFHGALGQIRRDLKTPAWRLLAETDAANPGAQLQSDHEYREPGRLPARLMPTSTLAGYWTLFSRGIGRKLRLNRSATSRL